MYDGKSSEKNPNQSSVENAVEREATFFLRSLRSRSPYMYPQLTCAPPTHLCPPLHHYVHHRSAPRRPRSQLQRVRRDAITVRRSFSERRSSAARSHWRGGVADSAPACSACRLHLGEHRSNSPRFLPIGPHPSLPSPRHLPPPAGPRAGTASRRQTASAWGAS